MSREIELSREDLARVVDAVRAMAQASASGDVDELLSVALGIAMRATESDGAVAYRLDESGDLLVRIAASPQEWQRDQALARFAHAGTWTGSNLLALEPSAQPVGSFSPDAQAALRARDVVHLATFPLQIRGRPTGALNLTRRIDRAFSARDLKVGAILSDVLVVHIENARLFADASSRLDEMRMLLDVARTVTAAQSLNERLEASAEILARMIDASNAFIVLLDEGGTVLKGVASANPALRDFVRGVRLPLTAPSSSAVEAVKTRRTIVVSDAQRSREVHRELVDRLGEKSLVAIPLIARGEPIGVVIIDDTRRARMWGAAEIERAELIATQVATAVANARLFDEVKQGYEQLAQAQEELVKRERLAALGQLAATLAHEVRNPLGVLYNSLGTLSKLLPKTGDAATLLAIMVEETRRLDRLVRELLDFARPLLPSIEPHSIADVIDEAIRAATQQLGAEASALRAEVPPDFPPVSVDHTMMRRALVNLLVNGAQAAGAAGSVAIRVSAEDRAGRHVARIEVSDTGPGIAPEIAGRVFEPFFTTKATGTGLGLAIVKSIVEAHRGEIELDGGGESGARVTLFIPLEPEPETRPPA